MNDSVLWTDLYRLADREAKSGDARAKRVLERFQATLAKEQAMHLPQLRALYGDNPISQRDEE